MTIISQAIEIITSRFPQLQEDLLHYIEGILTKNKEEFENIQDIFEAIGFVFLDAFPHSDENQIRILCEDVYNMLSPNSKVYKKLDQPVHLGSLAKQMEIHQKDLSFQEASKVDMKKLQKAEIKLKSKAHKRWQHAIKEQEQPIVSSEPSVVQGISKQEQLLFKKTGNSMTSLKLENFDISFANKTLITNATLTLVNGRKYGLIGKNGTGKTTLLRSLSNGYLQLPVNLRMLHVEQEVIGDDTTVLNSVLQSDAYREALKKEEFYLTDLINSGSNDPHVHNRLVEVYAKLQSICDDQLPAHASVILSGLGFDIKMQKQPTKLFSGGMRMRIALARALFSKPDLLLLDEPTNMLDIHAIIWLQHHLKSWNSMLLVASHDQSFLEEVTTDILFLEKQQLGNYTQFVKTQKEKRQCQEREYNAQQQLRAHTQEFIDRFRYNAKRASLVQSKIKMLEKLPLLMPVEKENEIHFVFPEVNLLSPPILYLDEVTFEYDNNKPVLSKINFSATLGSRICIVGENGAGKSTLLHILRGFLKPTSGIQFSHHNLKVGYFAQHHIDQLDLSLTSLENLQKNYPGQKLEEYLQQLGRFSLTGGLQYSQVASLSGGQKSRLAFAILSMMKPNFLILDEPTNHLDIETINALASALNKYMGGTVMVSHDESFIYSTCNEIWICENHTVKKLKGDFKEYRKTLEKTFIQ